jgi:hypothetical protein
VSFKVIDNFLEPYFIEKFIKEISSSSIPWFYRPLDVEGTSTKNKNGYFNHTFYNEDEPLSPLYKSFIKEILQKMNASTAMNVTANLCLRDIDCIESAYHVDEPYTNSKTAILYLTTCNAKTILKINDKEIPVESIKNRLLVFNTNIKHKVIYQTDKHKRYVINFNYYERS